MQKSKRSMKLPPKEPEGKQVSVRLPKHLYARIETLTKANPDYTQAEIIRLLLERGFQALDKEEGGGGKR